MAKQEEEEEKKTEAETNGNKKLLDLKAHANNLVAATQLLSRAKMKSDGDNKKKERENRKRKHPTNIPHAEI